MTGFVQDLTWRLEGLAFGVYARLFRAMPLDRASALGGRLFRRFGPMTKAHKVAERNMEIAFPDKDAAWRAGMLDRMWDNTGRTVGEMPHLHGIDPYDSDGRITVEGVEILDSLRESGRAAVFTGGHFGNIELMAIAIVKRGVDCAITYRAANNPYFDARLRAMRHGFGFGILSPKAGPKGAKQLLEHLAAGRSVALMNDQKFNEGIEVPFFGRPAMTAPGPTRLAMRTGAPLIPVSMRRLEGARFAIRIYDPIPIPDTGDRAADIYQTVLTINRFIEDRIREDPPQWFWVHRRFPKAVYGDKAKHAGQ